MSFLHFCALFARRTFTRNVEYHSWSYMNMTTRNWSKYWKGARIKRRTGKYGKPHKNVSATNQALQRENVHKDEALRTGLATCEFCLRAREFIVAHIRPQTQNSPNFLRPTVYKFLDAFTDFWLFQQLPEPRFGFWRGAQLLLKTLSFVPANPDFSIFKAWRWKQEPHSYI